MDHVHQNLHAAPPHLLHRLAEGGQHGMEILRHGQAVDGDNGAVLRHPASRLPQRPHGAQRHVVGNGKHRREVRPLPQPLRRGPVGVPDVKGPGADHQFLLRRQAAVRQRPEIPLIAQLADGPVIGAGHQRRNAAVSAAVQLRHGPIGLLLVSDGHRCVGALRQCAVLIGVGAADEGYVQHGQLLRRIVGSSAQKHDAPQPLLPLHHSPPLDLVIAGADLLHHHGKALGGDAVLDGPDDVGIEGVGHAPHHQPNGVGLGLDQIPCGVVGDVVGAFNDLQHPASVLFADVRSVIEHTGYRADADAAEPGNIFDGHR